MKTSKEQAEELAEICAQSCLPNDRYEYQFIKRQVLETIPLEQLLEVARAADKLIGQQYHGLAACFCDHCRPRTEFWKALQNLRNTGKV